MRNLMLAAAFCVALVGCGPSLDGLEKGETGRVVEVRDGDTFVLDTGLTVHLAEITAPQGAGQYRAAREALERLALEREVRLAYGGEKRYREAAIAHVWAKTEGGRWVWVQQALALEGQTMVRSRKENYARVGELLAAERNAREGKRGLWADAEAAPVDAASLSRGAEDIAADPVCQAAAAERASASRAAVQSIAAVTPGSDGATRETRPARRSGPRSVFTLVEGRVQEVAVRDTEIYLNFGPDYRRDFGVRLDKEDVDAWPGGQAAIEALAGKSVRVRGLLRPCAKPLMSLDHPSQIEMLAG
jgi:endonuclease YncB( thermonuclease family)